MIPSSQREVLLPQGLCEAAEQRFGQDFGGLEQFLAFVLREMLRNDAEGMNEAEQFAVEQRLRDLGYM